MRLTPGSERDSIWSTPLASVKNRSNRPVMSVSICSGGMPLKNVATTTTGILIGGNKSTGIRNRLVTPTTHVIRQMTMTKYGKRKAKRDMKKNSKVLGAGGRAKFFDGDIRGLAKVNQCLFFCGNQGCDGRDFGGDIERDGLDAMEVAM